MAKLYEISESFNTLVDFDMSTDDDVKAFSALMNEVQGAFEDKAENICKLIRNLQSEAEAFKAEKQRLEKKQKALENKADALKSYLEYNARQFLQQGEKRKVGLFTLSFRKTPGKLVYDDEAMIPVEFFKRSVDVAKLKDAVQSGNVIEGVRIETGDTLMIG